MLSAALKADGEQAWAGGGEVSAFQGQMRCGLSQCHGSVRDAVVPGTAGLTAQVISG